MFDNLFIWLLYNDNDNMIFFCYVFTYSTSTSNI